MLLQHEMLEKLVTYVVHLFFTVFVSIKQMALISTEQDGKLIFTILKGLFCVGGWVDFQTV